MRLALLLLAALLSSSLAWSQRLLTTPDFTTFSARGNQEQPSLNFTSMADGGTLVHGYFEVWYEGHAFRDLLRLKPGGDPDTRWKVVGDTTISGISSVSITPFGVYLGSAGRVWRAPLDGGSTMVPVGAASPSIAGLSNYHAATGSLYAVSDGGLVRIDAATGQVTPVWKGRFQESVLFTNPLKVDAGGGVWATYAESIFMLVSYRTARYSIAELAADPTGTARSTHYLSGDTNYTPIGASGAFFYLSNQRRLSNGDIDRSWVTQFIPLHIGEKYVYLKAYDGLPEWSIGSITRVGTDGSGAMPWRFEWPAGFQWAGAFVVWPTAGDADNLGVLGRRFPVDNIVQPLALAVKEDLTGMTDPTVVEYYLPALKRYFMTGRKNEQDALDALPQSFQRTGMTFAAKSNRYRDIPEQPVCRMYFPPANGGSNTHFYGIGNDCGQLNKLGGMKYEGYDFSVRKAVNGYCDVTAPNVVTRLYNNKAATNESNHRYVVSAATKARMVAQGWVDEGAVFCAGAVTDAPQ